MDRLFQDCSRSDESKTDYFKLFQVIPRLFEVRQNNNRNHSTIDKDRLTITSWSQNFRLRIWFVCPTPSIDFGYRCIEPYLAVSNRTHNYHLIEFVVCRVGWFHTCSCCRPVKRIPVAVGRSISDGDPRPVWGSFSRLDQSPTPYTRRYPSTIAIVKERNKKEMLRLGLLRDGCTGRFDGRSKFVQLQTGTRISVRSRLYFTALVNLFYIPQFSFFFFLYLSTPVSPVRLISRILKELGTWSLLTVERGADYAAITRYKETKYRRRRHCFTFCLGMAQPVQKYTNYRPNVRLEVHVGRLIAFKRQSVLRHEMLLFVMCKAKSYFCLECFNKPH